MTKLTVRYVTSIAIGLLCVACYAQDAKPETTNQNNTSGDSLQQKASYLLGYNLIRNFQLQGFECDLESLMKGIKDATAKKQPPMTDYQIPLQKLILFL